MHRLLHVYVDGMDTKCQVSDPSGTTDYSTRAIDRRRTTSSQPKTSPMHVSGTDMQPQDDEDAEGVARSDYSLLPWSSGVASAIP